MKARVIGIILFAVVLAAAPGARQQGGAITGQAPATAKPPAPKRAVIVTGENSFNGHVWKDTSTEIKSILDVALAPHDLPDPEDLVSAADQIFLELDRREQSQ